MAGAHFYLVSRSILIHSWIIRCERLDEARFNLELQDSLWNLVSLKNE